MKKEKQTQRAKYPEQRKFKKVLLHGDYAEIARRSGLKVQTVMQMFNGHLKLAYSVKQAIIDISEERRQVDERLDEIINQEGE